MVETVLTALAPVVVTLLLGFAAAWHQDFGAKDAAVLNRMVLLYAVPVALFLGMLFALVPSIVLLARHGLTARKMKIPFAPFLALGGVVALFAGNALLDWYLRFL